MEFRIIFFQCLNYITLTVTRWLGLGLRNLRSEKRTCGSFSLSYGVYKIVHCIVQENPHTLDSKQCISVTKQYISVGGVIPNDCLFPLLLLHFRYCLVPIYSTGSGQGPVAGCCECGDEPSGSCATELVS
jgi:hypothetical protein